MKKKNWFIKNWDLVVPISIILLFWLVSIFGDIRVYEQNDLFLFISRILMIVFALSPLAILYKAYKIKDLRTWRIIIGLGTLAITLYAGMIIYALSEIINSHSW